MGGELHYAMICFAWKKVNNCVYFDGIYHMACMIIVFK